MSEKIEHAPNFGDFMDEEVLEAEMTLEEAFAMHPTDSSVVVCRNAVWMQVRRVEGEQRIEI